MHMDSARCAYRQIHISVALYVSAQAAHLGDEPRQPARLARVESALQRPPPKHSCSRPSIHPSFTPIARRREAGRAHCPVWAHVSTRKRSLRPNRRLGRFAGYSRGVAPHAPAAWGRSARSGLRWRRGRCRQRWPTRRCAAHALFSAPLVALGGTMRTQ